jgi:hypothetical protein
MFGTLDGTEKKKLVIEWMKQQGPVDAREWSFPVPFIIDSTETDSWGEDVVLKKAQICNNAVLEVVIGQRKTWWWTCAKHAKQNTVPGCKKLKGKPSNQQKSEHAIRHLSSDITGLSTRISNASQDDKRVGTRQSRLASLKGTAVSDGA